jgi:hypothetical protein
LLVALGCAWFFLATAAIAQNACQKDEIFGGYSWLAPNGYGDLDYKINDIPSGFDASNTYYLPGAHNVGILLDGSGHFHGGTTPPNLQNGSNNSTAVGYALGGLQYKFHANTLSPFFRGFLGAASISPDCCHGNEWSFAAGGGGGLDLNVAPRFSIRLIQADYIYSSYSHVFPSTHSTAWNSARLAAGLVFNLGNYCARPQPVCTASASPKEVNQGEPVHLSSTGTEFVPKHLLVYAWTITGGKLSSPKIESPDVDTTGLGPGTYTASTTITDPKLKKLNSATCSATFVVLSPPLKPLVKCASDVPKIDPGQTANITMTAASPDNRPMNFTWTTTGGQLSGSGGTTTALTATNNDAGSTITVTGTATDDRSLSDSCTVQVSIAKLPPPCLKLEDWGKCTFEKDHRHPTRVDNDCKDTLDALALKLQSKLNGKLVIVGAEDESESAREQSFAAHRAVNVKYYLTEDGSTQIDADRILTNQGGTKEKAAYFYFVPPGSLCPGQADLGTAIDTSKVKGQTRKAPANKKKVEQRQ